MADGDREDGNGTENGERTGTEHEHEHVVTRADGAAALRRLADAVANGSVTLGDEVTATIPERFELELEYEQDDEEAELEVELEWPVVDGEAVPAEREPAGSEGETESADGKGDDGDDAADTAPADEMVAAELVGTGDVTSKARFELYRDRADEWRWRLIHDNGNIIADSGEGYDRKATARNGLESVMRNAPGAAVVETND